MKKCAMCGKSFLLGGAVQLKDAVICKKCFFKLGFDKSYLEISEAYSYDEIKDGFDQYLINAEKEQMKDDVLSSIAVTSSLDPKELNCTEEEREIYDIVTEMLDDSGIDLDPLEFVRMSDNYVTIKYGEWDLVRCKYTVRAQWISFPSIEKASEHHPISSPEGVYDLSDLLFDSIKQIQKYS